MEGADIIIIDTDDPDSDQDFDFPSSPPPLTSSQREKHDTSLLSHRSLAGQSKMLQRQYTTEDYSFVPRPSPNTRSGLVHVSVENVDRPIDQLREMLVIAGSGLEANRRTNLDNDHVVIKRQPSSDVHDRLLKRQMSMEYEQRRRQKQIGVDGSADSGAYRASPMRLDHVCEIENQPSFDKQAMFDRKQPSFDKQALFDREATLDTQPTFDRAPPLVRKASLAVEEGSLEEITGDFIPRIPKHAGEFDDDSAGPDIGISFRNDDSIDSDSSSDDDVSFPHRFPDRIPAVEKQNARQVTVPGVESSQAAREHSQSMASPDRQQVPDDKPPRISIHDPSGTDVREQTRANGPSLIQARFKTTDQDSLLTDPQHKRRSQEEPALPEPPLVDSQFKIHTHDSLTDSQSSVHTNTDRRKLFHADPRIATERQVPVDEHGVVEHTSSLSSTQPAGSEDGDSSVLRHIDPTLSTFFHEKKLTFMGITLLYRVILSKEAGVKSRCVRFIQNFCDIEVYAKEEEMPTHILPEITRILFHLFGQRFIFYRQIQSQKTEGMYNSVQHPTTHLLLWAILADRPKTIVNLVHMADYPLGHFVLAAMCYKELADRAVGTDETLTKLWLRHASCFEQVACELLTALAVRCHDAAVVSVGQPMDILMSGHDSNRRSDNPVTPAENRGLVTPLQCAVEGKLSQFNGHPVTQTYLRKLFYNEIECFHRYWTFLPIAWLPPIPLLLAKYWRLIRYETRNYLANTDTYQDKIYSDSLYFRMLKALSPGTPPPCGAHIPDTTGHNVSIKETLLQYYSSPVIRFQCYLLSFICVLVILCHTVVYDLTMDWLVALWLATFLINDIDLLLGNSGVNTPVYMSWTNKKLISRDHNWSILERMRLGFCSPPMYTIAYWCKHDWWSVNLSIFVLFACGFFVHHCTTSGHGVTRILYVLCIFLMYITIIRFAILWKRMSDVVIGIYLVAKSVAFVVFLLFVIAVGFGVAYLAILHPGNPDTGSDSKNGLLVFFRPFWHIFGFLQLDQMHEEMKDTAYRSCAEENFDMFDPETWSVCYSGWMAPILAALFVTLAHLVFISFIIAMVCHTYAGTLTEARQIWGQNTARIILWSARLPIPPPPLNLICYTLRLLIVIILLVVVAIGWILRKTADIGRRDLMNFHPWWGTCFERLLKILWVLCRRDVKQFACRVENQRRAVNEAVVEIDLETLMKDLDQPPG